MTGATLIAVFLIPLFYWMLQSLSEKYFGGNKQPPKDGNDAPAEIDIKEAHDE